MSTTITPEIIEAVRVAANQAANLIQEADESGGEVVTDASNLMVNAILTLIEDPAATLAEIFRETYGDDATDIIDSLELVVVDLDDDTAEGENDAIG